MASRPPKCLICSFNQPRPEDPVAIYHRHRSARQVRVLQGVEFSKKNREYFCPTCQISHLARMPYGLDICVGDSMLHEIHNPRDPGVVCPADTSHIDWLTIPGAKIDDLMYAWRLDYHKEENPMRVMLVAGVNNLIKGEGFDQITDSIERFWWNVECQNKYHPDLPNSFAVAPILPVPKLVWYPDNGEHSPQYRNRRAEVERLNEWIKEFNTSHGVSQVPRFGVWGTRSTKRYVNGVVHETKTHRWNDWRSSEADEDKVHLKDSKRIQMAKYIMKYFEGVRVRQPHGN